MTQMSLTNPLATISLSFLVNDFGTPCMHISENKQLLTETCLPQSRCDTTPVPSDISLELWRRLNLLFSTGILYPPTKPDEGEPGLRVVAEELPVSLFLEVTAAGSEGCIIRFTSCETLEPVSIKVILIF